jgi:hypothetical protein
MSACVTAFPRQASSIPGRWPRYAETNVPITPATTMVDSLLILADEGAGIAAPEFPWRSAFS